MTHEDLVKRGKELARKNKERLEKMSPDERKEYFAKLAAKRKKTNEKNKVLSTSLKKIVNGTYIDEIDGTKLTIADKMNIALTVKAMKGDVEAYKVVRDTIGEKPTDKAEMDTTIKITLSDEIKKLAK